MKKLALLFSFLFVATVVSAAPAKSAHHSKSHDTAKAAAKATGGVEAMGEVVSVDAAKKTVTFKNDKGETLTWPAEGAAADSLKTLKAGDKIAITYSVDAAGAPKAIIAVKAAPTK
jgi:Cu/Ag efflux protein CusF